MTKILIADDHELFRDGLKMVLKHLHDGSDAVTVIEAGDFQQAVDRAREADGLDLVLLDLSMPGMGWADGLQVLLKTIPDTPVVILSAAQDHRLVLQAVKMGAAGYIPKTSSSKVMISALKLVLSGGVYLPPTVLAGGDPPQEPADGHPVPGSVSTSLLTPRQREVLALVGRGKSNKEIARDLNLSEGTVKLHVTAILKALNVSNRTGAVVAASQLGLTTLGGIPEESRSGTT